MLLLERCPRSAIGKRCYASGCTRSTFSAQQLRSSAFLPLGAHHFPPLWTHRAIATPMVTLNNGPNTWNEVEVVELQEGNIDEETETCVGVRDLPNMLNPFVPKSEF